ncbi:NADH dehydrogenase [ubiquinone] 1 beta subcomplex subunit 7 [Lotus japonicus]|uniref:NADH dehydrogenase [ubiquinone] 1 beta subcomplex subunit 7 n=1 Tax=Lotus japonicus TaxID=34305 RepID=UPI002583FDC2|nr:NADH dehydrogenase [ubiquinone] 1 beta subcomplex subunit 7 [Lotus japonicus]
MRITQHCVQFHFISAKSTRERESGVELRLLKKKMATGEGSSKKMIATPEEMVEARVPLAYRDECAHLLIPLNKCRQAEFYLPWKCENERHSYEKCEYELVMERMLQMKKIREQSKQTLPQAAAGGASVPLIPKPANA